uniref:Uncharacterized protein n=1 Tax=Pelusios castaneus TaxID=367368 RepID=A0A8C8RIN3_9SAUR
YSPEQPRHRVLPRTCPRAEWSWSQAQQCCRVGRRQGGPCPGQYRGPRGGDQLWRSLHWWSPPPHQGAAGGSHRPRLPSEGRGGALSHRAGQGRAASR